MKYRLERECWNDRTFNGHTDSPYWRITIDGYEIGLKDDGTFWSIINGINVTYHIIEQIKSIISECKLPITLKIN